MSTAGRRIVVTGTVQGVGFRPWVYRLARANGLVGRVRNAAAGVTIESFGSPAALDAFLDALARERPHGASVDGLAWAPIAVEPATEFVIAASDAQGPARLSLAPDRATCAACLADVRDPRNRRYRYAFTTCADCGPRYTIAHDAPYDRRATAMARFPMCAACRREHADPCDRRFHAEANACPACGPALVARAAGAAVPGDPLDRAAAALRAGGLVAVKGLGGYHLACDATDGAAVSRLRAAKGRAAKPFAVMVADLGAAARLARLDGAARALLAGAERPIVLLAPRRPGPLAAAVAPGAALLGLFLPYTPLHHLLLDAVDRPLVLTSANRADEPIVVDDGEAEARVGGLVDLVLAHDRPIAGRCDDSVARVIAGAPTLLRRSRGWTPRPLRVARPFAAPVLACGGHLKNAVCIGVGDAAYLGAHVGDLGSPETTDALGDAVERLCRLLGVRPALVAHDLHPEYLSTEFARRWPATARVGVQHHHAHVASAMGEHGLGAPVLGVAYDGTGLGPDGSAWGGEVLLADLDGFERLATFRPLALAGGDTAIRQVWRQALALLDDAFDGDPPLDRFPLFARLAALDVDRVRRLLGGTLPLPRAHGVGRYFDAVGALLLGQPAAAYEGQVAMAVEGLAAGRHGAPYPFALDTGATPWSVDCRPATRALVADAVGAMPPAAIAARFQATVVAATTAVARAAARRHGRLPVVLTGGCFQNAGLATRVRAALARHHDVHLHRQVPPGDGGLAFGQALVADAAARRGELACA